MNLKRSLGGLAISLAELIVGILLLVDPIDFTAIVLTAAGIGLMLWGVGSVILYFTTAPEEAAARKLLAKGLTLLLCGGFCVLNTHWFAVVFPVLTLLYGIVTLVMGLTKLQWMLDILRLKRKRWLLAGISAAVSILCGVVIIADPFSSTAVLWMFAGISLIAEAALDVLAAIFGNRAREEADQADE